MARYNIRKEMAIRRWLAGIGILVIWSGALLLQTIMVNADDLGSSDLKSITWKLDSTTKLGNINYHIRKIVAVNGVSVDSSDDMKTSYAFCVEPLLNGPDGGASTGDTYTAGATSDGGGGEKIYTFNGQSAAEDGFKMMRKLCYYLPSGYGWTKTTKKWYQEYKDSLGDDAGSTDLRSSYTLGAIVLAKRWAKDADEPEGNANYAYNKLDDKGKALVNRFLNDVKDLPNPPDNYIAFYVQKEGVQDIWGSLYATEYGKVKVVKKTSRPKITDDNDCYSLRGAEFTLYTDSSCSTGSKAKFKDGSDAVLVTDEDGNTEEHEIETGDYYIRETKAPEGYAIDETVAQITVEKDATYEYSCKDEPVTDLVDLLLTKKPKDSATGQCEGDTTLAGAVYEFRYYDGQYSTASRAEASGDPTATWNLVTDAEGKISGRAPQKASGMTSSPFYKDMDGNITYPLGTYVIKEIKASPGYLVNDEKIIVHITEDKTGSPYVRTYNEDTTGEETIVKGGVKAPKIDAELDESYAQGDATLAGAELTVYNQSGNPVTVNGIAVAKGEAALVIKTDANGNASTGARDLPYGTYSIKETAPSPGYLINTTWSRTFQIREDGMIVDLTDTPLKEPVVRGGLKLTKVDADTGKSTPQGDAKFEGITFEIINNSSHDVMVGGTRYSKGQTVMKITARSGSASTGARDLPYGHYLIKESASAEGYRLNPDWRGEAFVEKDGVISEASPAKIPDQVKRFGLRIQKIDNDLEEAYAQGDAALAGAEFTIINKSANSIVTRDAGYLSDKTPSVDWSRSEGSMPSGAKEVAKDAAAGIIRTDANGASATLKDDLAYGTYLIKETRPSEGYTLNSAWTFTVKVFNADGKDQVRITGTNNTESVDETIDFTEGMIVDLSGYMVKEPVIRGGVQIIKRDKELAKSEALGGAKLDGIVMTIRNASEKDVVVRKDLDSVNGASADKIDWKSYESRKAALEKSDLIRVPAGEDVGKIVTHWNEEKQAYTAETLADDLPYGTYTIRESKTNESYQRSDKAEHRFTVREDGVIVSYDDENSEMDLIFDDYVYRSDVQGTKIADSSSERFSFVPFKITSVTNDETHVVVTDKNGFFSTKDRRSAGDLDEDEDADTARKQNPFDDLLEAADIKTADLEKRQQEILQGVWFGTGEHESRADMDIKFGALPYDSYILEEMPCEHNEGYTLQKFWFTVDQKSQNGMIDLETITDDVPEIGTEASVNGENIGVSPQSEIRLTDVIEYSGLKRGEKYTARGVLMDKATGKPALDPNGNEITAEKEFMVFASNGKVRVIFEFDAGSLYGKDTVVFERVYDAEGHLAVKHEEIDDESQTVTWVKPDPKYEMYKIRTTKAPSKGDKFGFFRQDEVEYEVHIENTGNMPLTMDVTDIFTEHAEYFTEPVLKDVKFTGKGTWNNKGKHDRIANISLEPEASAVVLYTATVKEEAKEYLAAAAGDSDSLDDKGSDTNMSYQRNVTDDNDGYRNEASCENVTYPDPEKPGEPGKLEPKKDVAQTPVQEPVIRTDASVDGEDENITPESGIKLTDSIQYSGLKAGREYTAKGILMDKKTGKPCLDPSGKEITAEERFTARESSGKVDVIFTFDAMSLYGTETVVFERIFDAEGNLTVAHEDISDKDQTVTWEDLKPSYEMYKIRTSKAPAKGKKYGFMILDTVMYDVCIMNTGNTELTMDVRDRFSQGPDYFTVPVVRDVKFRGKGLWNNKSKKGNTANITIVPGSSAVVTFSSDVLDDAEEYLADSAKDSDSLDSSGKPTNMLYQKNRTDDNDGYRNEAVCENVTYPDPENPDEPGSLEPKKDVAQTPVQRPYIGTVLTDEDGSKSAGSSKQTVLTDTVELKHLDTSEWYIVEGMLMIKDSEEPLMSGGRPVTSVSEPFRPKTGNGRMRIRFRIDTSSLKGKELVAFETAYRLDGYSKGDKVSSTPQIAVAEHRDINDPAQTVRITDKPVKSIPPRTGDDSLLWIYGIMFTSAFAASIILIAAEYRRTRKQKREDMNIYR